MNISVTVMYRATRRHLYPERIAYSLPIIVENRQLVTIELVEFDQQPLQVSRQQTKYLALHKNAKNTPQINQGKSKDINI